MDYATLTKQLGNRPSKKLGNNTYAVRVGGDAVAVRLHQTDILEFRKSGKVIARMGGWNTLTTRDRLNGYLPHGFRVTTRSGLAYWYGNGAGLVPFTDGDSIYRGKLRAQRKNNKADLRLKKRIAAYAQKCADSVPLSEPGAGDCFGPEDED